MLDRIIHFSLNNRVSVIAGAILLIITGTIITARIDIDIFPELTAPTVVIMTEAGGMAPEEVESLVTFPIETAVNGATSIRRVRSTSTTGFSIVNVEFDWGTDIYKARQTVAERLVQVSDKLPAYIERPVMAPQTSLLGEMMIVALESDSLDMMDLRTMADWVVVPRLLSVAGVAQVNVIGGDVREYQILADPNKMDFYGVTLGDLVEKCRDLNINTSGSFINQHGNIYIVRGMARTDRLTELASSVIGMRDGLPVRLSDVAAVGTGSAPSIGTASYRGRNAVLLTITRQPDANTVTLSENIKSVIDELQRNTGSTATFHTDIYDQASFIKTSVRNVMKALLEGGIFVVIILFLFLFNTRTTVISLLAMPLSLLVTIITLKLLGYTINTMSLGGMAIAIGSLVDDAIIDVENIYKQLRRNSVLPPEERKPSIDIVYRASTEVRSSIWNATLIIIISFFPLFFLGDLEGRMLRPLGISFIISLFASLIVAVTITPVLSSYLLTDEGRLRRNIKGSWIERNLGRIYSKALDFTLLKSRELVGATVIVFIISVLLMTGTGSSFLPDFNEGALTVNISLPPGISLEESAKAGTEAQKILLSVPEVRTVAGKTGRAELAEHFFSENMSEIDVPFELTDRSREELFADVRERLSTIPGANIEVGQPITHRMDRMLSGTRANIAIKIFGDDLNELYRVANTISEEIAPIGGIGDLTVEQLVETPQLKIKPDREMLATYGIGLDKFNSFIEFAIGGQSISDVYEGEKRFPLVLRYNDETRGSIEGIGNSLIDTHDGGRIPLSFVSSMESSSGPSVINRENVRRRIVISVNTAGRDVGSVVRDIKEKIGGTIVLPEGWHIEYGGQFESAESATKRLVTTSLLAIMVIFLILYQEFRNSTLSVLVLLNLPLALIGGVIAIKLTSNVISIPSIIGFITLFGIATRNGILLISRYIHLKQEGLGLHDRILTGSVDRLNPILMTALTAALALIPMAMGGDKPGNEIQSPMAVVILGGLLSSTLLNIFIIPSVYYMLSKRKENV